MLNTLQSSTEQSNTPPRITVVLKPGFLFHGRYLIVRQLSSGVSGTVYEAVDRRTRQRVSLKHLSVVEANTAFEAQFMQVSPRLLSLEHPHLARVVDMFTANEGCFVVSELIAGDDLWTLMQQRQMHPFPVHDVLDWAEQVLQALTALQTIGSGMTHGDIKPHNLRIVAGRGVVLVDIELNPMSLASLIENAVDLNDTVFCAPEKLQGQPLTPAADLYALGATLYLLLTGSVPPSALERALALSLGAPDPLVPIQQRNASVSAETAAVVERALAYAPAERFQDATQMWQALGDHLELPALVVGSGKEADFATITAALAAAEPAQRIVIQPGRYAESLTLEQPVSLIGEGLAGEVLIESSDAACLTILSDQVNVHNLTLVARKVAPAEPFFAVAVAHGSAVIEQCTITSESLACLSLHGSTTAALVRGCTIRNGAAAGIDIYDGAQGTVEDCQIFGNTRAGIEISNAANPVIRRCKIQHGLASGIFVTENGLGVIEDCEILANGGAGVAVSFGGNPIIRHSTISSNSGAGVFVYKQGLGTIEHCTIAGNQAAGVEIKEGGDPTVRRCEIHSGWFSGIYAHAYALGRVTGCQIYANTDANVTIAEHSAIVLRECQIYDGKAEGVWVTRRGEGTLESCDIYANTQANLTLHAGSNPIIKRCQIRNGLQAGVLADEDAGGLLDECQISGNGESGVVLQERSNITLMRCRIQQNQQYGVVIERNASGVVRECTLSLNVRGAWYQEGRNQVRSIDNSE